MRKATIETQPEIAGVENATKLPDSFVAESTLDDDGNPLAAIREKLVEELAAKVASNKITIEEAKATLFDAMYAETIRLRDQKLNIVSDVESDKSIDDDMVLIDILEGDDYVQKKVSKSELVKIVEAQSSLVIDPFALSKAYQEGDAARFEYYFSAPDDNSMLLARQRGWVTVKKSLDGQHDDSTGAAKLNEMFLMRRPKANRHIYEKEDRLRQEAMMGKPAQDVRDMAEQDKRYLRVDDSAITITEREMQVSPDARKRDNEEMADRIKTAASGRKSFNFPRNPIYDNKLNNARAVLHSTN